VTVRRPIAAFLALAALAAAGASASGDTPKPRPATAKAEAYARQDLPAEGKPPKPLDRVAADGTGDRAAGAQQTADIPPDKPSDTTHAGASTVKGRGTATATATARKVDIFDGLVTADAVSARADASGGSTSTGGSISALVIDGKPAESPTGRTVYDLGGYGKAVALDSGATGVMGLRARLTKAYKTHRAGEEVRVAYASAKAADAVAPAPAKPAAGPAKKAPKKKAKLPKTPLEKVYAAIANRRDRRWRRELLRAPGYAFPVAGVHNFTDTFGAARSDVPVHIGNDIFATFGTPIVAVADGTVYRVGTLKISGNRLWLRDRKGNRYFYCHLSYFAAAAYNGAAVHAGEVIGFVGNTGDAEPTPPHLHFEVHMPDGKVVPPYTYLHKWERTGVGTAKWLRRYGKDPGVRPGALVVVKDFLAEP
jgi:murein DD-endopeptidase MepM/ murein hydrolase activator NlpD